MLTLAEFNCLMQKPEMVEAERIFVTKPRQTGKIRKSQFSLGRLIQLLMADLSFEEIGLILGISDCMVKFYYDNYCHHLSVFKGETGIERRIRISVQRRITEIERLKKLPLQDPLLIELAQIATGMGSVVAPIIWGAEHKGALRLSS